MTIDPRITRFKELFGLIKPDAPMTERIAFTSKLALLSESSIRVYLMDSPPHSISNRSLLILEKAMRQRKIIWCNIKKTRLFLGGFSLFILGNCHERQNSF